MQIRAMLEQTLYNLRYDMDCIGCNDEIAAELAALSIADLEQLITEYLEEV